MHRRGQVPIARPTETTSALSAWPPSSQHSIHIPRLTPLRERHGSFLPWPKERTKPELVLPQHLVDVADATLSNSTPCLSLSLIISLKIQELNLLLPCVQAARGHPRSSSLELRPCDRGQNRRRLGVHASSRELASMVTGKDCLEPLDGAVLMWEILLLQSSVTVLENL
jgi:hypothetical protein